MEESWELEKCKMIMGEKPIFKYQSLGEEITRRGNWQQIDDVDWKDDEERDMKRNNWSESILWRLQ